MACSSRYMAALNPTRRHRTHHRHMNVSGRIREYGQSRQRQTREVGHGLGEVLTLLRLTEFGPWQRLLGNSCAEWKAETWMLRSVWQKEEKSSHLVYTYSL